VISSGGPHPPAEHTATAQWYPAVIAAWRVRCQYNLILVSMMGCGLTGGTTAADAVLTLCLAVAAPATAID